MLLSLMVLQVSGTGCGSKTEEGTVCGFSCNPQTSRFAQGTIECDANGNWVKSADAQCVPCENGGCQAQPMGCPTSLPIEQVFHPSNVDGYNDVCVPGFNFDPANDKVRAQACMQSPLLVAST